MPVFEYSALNQSGKAVKGTVESDSSRTARQKLKGQHLYVTDIREGNQKKSFSDIDVKQLFQSNKIKTKELTILTRQFATLIGAGLPLVSSLQALSEQTDSLVTRRIILSIKEKIVEIFQKQGAVLPLPTRILLNISFTLTHFWWALITFIIAAAYGFTAWKNTDSGRSIYDQILLKMPLIGGLYTKIATARVSRTLGTLLTTGVSLLTAMDIAKNIVNNVHVRSALENASVGVREGKSLAGELSRSGIFPSLLSHMIAVGERSGRMEPMLLKAGKSYESDVQASLAGLTSLIEPIMIITLGGIVFSIVIAVLMPMVDLINVVQK